VIPGIMPIQNYGGFNKMTSLCQTKVPKQIMEDLEAVSHDDKKVKEYGINL
jgi:methylenetetrahydrofolate reductase (NADPH)